MRGEAYFRFSLDSLFFTNDYCGQGARCLEPTFSSGISRRIKYQQRSFCFFAYDTTKTQSSHSADGDCDPHLLGFDVIVI